MDLVAVSNLGLKVPKIFEATLVFKSPKSLRGLGSYFGRQTQTNIMPNCPHLWPLISHELQFELAHNGRQTDESLDFWLKRTHDSIANRPSLQFDLDGHLGDVDPSRIRSFNQTRTSIRPDFDPVKTSVPTSDFSLNMASRVSLINYIKFEFHSNLLIFYGNIANIGHFRFHSNFDFCFNSSRFFSWMYEEIQKDKMLDLGTLGDGLSTHKVHWKDPQPFYVQKIF